MAKISRTPEEKTAWHVYRSLLHQPPEYVEGIALLDTLAGFTGSDSELQAKVSNTPSVRGYYETVNSAFSLLDKDTYLPFLNFLVSRSYGKDKPRDGRKKLAPVNDIYSVELETQENDSQLAAVCLVKLLLKVPDVQSCLNQHKNQQELFGSYVRQMDSFHRMHAKASESLMNLFHIGEVLSPYFPRSLDTQKMLNTEFHKIEPYYKSLKKADQSVINKSLVQMTTILSTEKKEKP